MPHLVHCAWLLRHLAHTKFRQPLFRHQFAYRMDGQRLQFLTAVLVTTCHLLFLFADTVSLVVPMNPYKKVDFHHRYH